MDKIPLPGFKLIGIKLDKKTTNEDNQSGTDCGNLWQKFEKENIADQIPNKSGDEIYAVYFDYEGDYTKPFSYFIGCKVEEAIDAYENLDSLVIPGQTYIKLIAKGKMPDCIASAWRNIWNIKINRAYEYDYEVYDKRSKDWNNAEVEIFLSVK